MAASMRFSINFPVQLRQAVIQGQQAPTSLEKISQLIKVIEIVMTNSAQIPDWREDARVILRKVFYLLADGGSLPDLKLKVQDLFSKTFEVESIATDAAAGIDSSLLSSIASPHLRLQAFQAHQESVVFMRAQRLVDLAESVIVQSRESATWQEDARILLQEALNPTPEGDSSEVKALLQKVEDLFSKTFEEESIGTDGAEGIDPPLFSSILLPEVREQAIQAHQERVLFTRTERLVDIAEAVIALENEIPTWREDARVLLQAAFNPMPGRECLGLDVLEKRAADFLVQISNTGPSRFELTMNAFPEELPQDVCSCPFENTRASSLPEDPNPVSKK